MKRALKVFGIGLLVISLFVGAWVVDNLIYPFQSENPNFSDVEKAFAKLQFPSDWQEISSSENRGLHGRGCSPLNDAGCFHKSMTLKVPDMVSLDDVKTVFISAGCESVATDNYSYVGESKESTNFRCTIGNNVFYSSGLRGPTSELYVSATTN